MIRQTFNDSVSGFELYKEAILAKVFFLRHLICGEWVGQRWTLI